MAAHCGQGGIMAPLLSSCGFKQLLPVVAILLWDNFGKLEKLRLSDCESSPSRGSSKLNIKPGNCQFAGLALRKSMKSRGGSQSRVHRCKSVATDTQQLQVLRLFFLTSSRNLMLGFSLLFLMYCYFFNALIMSIDLILMLQCNDVNNFSSST